MISSTLCYLCLFFIFGIYVLRTVLYNIMLLYTYVHTYTLHTCTYDIHAWANAGGLTHLCYFYNAHLLLS